MSEFTNTNFSKLNVIQQKIADLFQNESLSRTEVFVVLKGLREFKMVNKELADKWYSNLRYADPENGFGSHPFIPLNELKIQDYD